MSSCHSCESNPAAQEAFSGQATARFSITLHLSPKANYLYAVGGYNNLENTYLNHADLSGANLKSAKNLTRDQVETAFIDKETILPDSISLIWVSNTEYEFE